MEQDRDFVLVEVLGSDAFADYHLPGAVNVPNDKRFTEEIQRVVPDRSKPVVVYCANEECTASPAAAQKLDQLGYEKVYDYEAGKEDWREASLPVES